MNIGKTALAAAIAAAAWGCAGPKQETVKTAPVSPVQSLGDSIQQMETLSAELKALPPAARAPSLGAAMKPLEPALCARFLGTAFDAAELSCIVGWMDASRQYLAAGGAPTKYTNRQEFESQKKAALEMLASAKWEAAAPVPAAAVASSNPGRQSSQQRYLEGVIAFQKGDNVQARAAWSDALKLDPSNADAQAGLELLEKREK